MTTLATLAVSVLRWVGRWVLRRLLELGRFRVTRYMAKRIRVFRRQSKEFSENDRPLRAVWNLRRALRWAAARRWILRHWIQLGKRGVHALDQIVVDHVPDQVPCETWSSWRSHPDGQEARDALRVMGFAS